MPDDTNGADTPGDDGIELYLVDEETGAETPMTQKAIPRPVKGLQLAEAPVAEDDDSSEAARLRAELEQLRDVYLRKLAEFDNYRKRTEREKDELQRTAGESLVRELLPVLDNFERALLQPPGADVNGFRTGVEMIAKQLWDMLQRQGVEKIDPIGEPFQPEFHEAVQRVEDSSHPPGTVVWVAAKGYLYWNRLIRPAIVGVAVEPSMPAATEEPQPFVEEADGEPSS
jgi:molecular chaperone GrpE